MVLFKNISLPIQSVHQKIAEILENSLEMDILLPVSDDICDFLQLFELYSESRSADTHFGETGSELDSGGDSEPDSDSSLGQINISEIVNFFSILLERILKIDPNNIEIQTRYKLLFDLLPQLRVDSTNTPNSNRSSNSSGGAFIPREFKCVFNEDSKYLVKRYGQEGIEDVETCHAIQFGDKLYGFKNSRENFLSALKRYRPSPSTRDAYTLDEYTDSIGISKVIDGDPDTPQAQEFKQFLIRNLASKEKVLNNKDQDDAVNKACKVGIDFALEKRMKIHFLLPTKLKCEKIFAESSSGLGFTARELRKMYRDWHKLQDTVIFYRQPIGMDPAVEEDSPTVGDNTKYFQEVLLPPWEEFPEQCLPYINKIARKRRASDVPIQPPEN